MLVLPSSEVLVDVNTSKETMTTKLMKLPAVLTHVALSRSNLYAKIKAGTFPQPISLGGRAVAWIDEEVQEWIDAAVDQSRNIAGLSKASA